MKYILKDCIVDAVVYKAGMEDGFSCISYWNECTVSMGDNVFKQCDVCKNDEVPKKPYINGDSPLNSHYKDFINEGDLIVIESNGEKYVCGPDEFFEEYEELKEPEIKVYTYGVPKLNVTWNSIK